MDTVKRISDHKQLGTRVKEPQADGRRPYEWKTYGEIYDLQNALALGKLFELEW